MKKKRVIIIGAGPAGLTAGYELLKQNKNYEVIILEASNHIGGISKTINHKGNRMDIGGHRFFSKDQKVINFWNNIMPTQGKPSYDDLILNRNKELPKKGPNPEKTDKVMLKRERISRIYYLKKFFDYPISMNIKTIKNLGLIKTINAGLSYLKSIIFKKKETSLENFYINRFGKKLYSMFFEDYTEKLWGRHPSNISADWGAQRVKGLSIIKLLKDTLQKTFHIKPKEIETSLIEEFLYPKYGPGQLWETVAEEFEKLGGKIYKEHTVIKINVKNSNITSVTCKTKEENITITGDIFISSMPLKDLTLNLTGIKIPKQITEIAKNLPYRDFITIGILTKKLKLKNETNKKTLNNIIPDCWIYVQEKDVKLGRIQIFNNWSPYMVKNPDKNIWIGLEYFCNENDWFWNLSTKERTALAIKELEKMDIINPKDVIDTHTEKIQKAYPAYFDSYKDIDKLIAYINKIPNLYCIGRNGQHRYNNMDHSMITAFETINNITNNIIDKQNIWNVNTEKKYHEKK